MKEAFLCGSFQDEKPTYMKVPESFKRHYQGDVLLLLLLLLLLLRKIYGLKKTARAFWCKLTTTLKDMGSL